MFLNYGYVIFSLQVAKILVFLKLEVGPSPSRSCCYRIWPKLSLIILGFVVDLFCADVRMICKIKA